MLQHNQVQFHGQQQRVDCTHLQLSDRWRLRSQYSCVFRRRRCRLRNYRLFSIYLIYGISDQIIIGTQDWIWGLGYSVSGSAWQVCYLRIFCLFFVLLIPCFCQVYTYNQQTAGYLTKWKNTKMGFLTIHGAGHEVPTYKPDVALDMWAKFLGGTFTNA